jgi:hypothetical protein
MYVSALFRSYQKSADADINAYPAFARRAESSTEPFSPARNRERSTCRFNSQLGAANSPLAQQNRADDRVRSSMLRAVGRFRLMA